MGNYYNTDNDNELLNKAKELVVYKLAREGYITEQEAEEFLNRAFVISYKKKWFKRWLNQSDEEEAKGGDDWFIKVIDISDKERNNEDKRQERRFKVLEYAVDTKSDNK